MQCGEMSYDLATFCEAKCCKLKLIFHFLTEVTICRAKHSITKCVVCVKFLFLVLHNCFVPVQEGNKVFFADISSLTTYL